MQQSIQHTNKPIDTLALAGPHTPNDKQTIFTLQKAFRTTNSGSQPVCLLVPERVEAVVMVGGGGKGGIQTALIEGSKQTHYRA